MISLIPCGPTANESEKKALQYLKQHLLSEFSAEEWVLLSNLTFAVTHQLQADEIDLVVIGPGGVRVIEIKHWTAQWVEANRPKVESEADRLTMKARKIAGTLRALESDTPYVESVFLLTQEASKVRKVVRENIRGTTLFSLKEWKDALGVTQPVVFTATQVKRLAKALHPGTVLSLEGDVRRLAGYVNLELQTPQSERFHRVYKGKHPERRDRVVLHVYDLSAAEDKDAEVRSRREFEALHRLQLYPWAPRILDSYQDIMGYAGEMYFFTVVDPAAPSVDKRQGDSTWHVNGRLMFAREAIKALQELHASTHPDEAPVVHRNINPATLLVRHDNTPIFTGFELTKLPATHTVTANLALDGPFPETYAPEIRQGGLSVADHHSDLYALCATLQALFVERLDEMSQRALSILERGLINDRLKRASPGDLKTAFGQLLGELAPPVAAPPARYWTEDQVVRFRDHDYRIVSRLGSGGVGVAFKVVKLDHTTRQELGSYVAKVVFEQKSGLHVLKAYNLVHPILRHTSLSNIYEVAPEWRENEFVALLTWVSGTPLNEYMGVFPLLAEDLGEADAEALALRWLREVCQGLEVLHRHGLIHGDVSPGNLIVSNTDLVLTDYDAVCQIGQSVATSGTPLYCAPSSSEGRTASPADDFYALAASFFHVLFEREPFWYAGEQDKQRGLNWDGLDRSAYPTVAEFLSQATHPDPHRRLANVTQALQALTASPVETGADSSASSDETNTQARLPVVFSANQVAWLQDLLQSYPGSLWGNSETRGLDSNFAQNTYVPTRLEQSLLEDIRARRARLVILCGNAGDGKTALLQHLATQLGLAHFHSGERIIAIQLVDGPEVGINLDGSAAWQGRSADDLLNEFLAPFQNGPPTEDLVHLLAINDGRLLEWINTVEQHNGGATSLTAALYDRLQEGVADNAGHIRFINLNQRSLVGAVDRVNRQIDTTFLDQLTDRLYGGKEATNIWRPCRSCSAQTYCEVYRTVRLFGPAGVRKVEPETGQRARQRLFQALQVVHLRADTHITMRELRAALVYILFGIHACQEYHANARQEFIPYWNRAFAPDSPARQGDVLDRLVRYDPALEAHPRLDRYLTSRSRTDSSNRPPPLESARRQAYFEWREAQLQDVADTPEALNLAQGKHLQQFRDLPLLDEEERASLCRKLCMGIARLEDLPPQAHQREGVVALRITPRTPTETAFWVEKPLSAFQLQADLPVDSEGVERLHRQAYLTYTYRDGRYTEKLRLGSQLFHLLMELAEGYQLGDVSTDDSFAHLSIFVQRLVREDERELLAWNPTQEEAIYRVATEMRQTLEGVRQMVVIRQLTSGGIDGQE